MRKYLLVPSFAMLAVLVVWAATPAQAQTASAPNRDLSGVWGKKQAASPSWAPNTNRLFAVEVPLQPWAQEHCRAVGCARGVDSAGTPFGNAYLQGEDPVYVRCAPNGFPRMLVGGGPMEIFQTANRVFMRFYFGNEMREIWTDGRISPDDALTQASAILQHHLDVFVGYDKNAVEFEEVADKQDDEKAKLKKLLNMSVNEIELSVRAANCLNNANITTVGQLAMKTEAEMLKYRNFGKKSLNEIKEKLTSLGLSLGMNIDPSLLEAPKEEAKA